MKTGLVLLGLSGIFVFNCSGLLDQSSRVWHQLSVITLQHLLFLVFRKNFLHNMLFNVSDKERKRKKFETTRTRWLSVQTEEASEFLCRDGRTIISAAFHQWGLNMQHLKDSESLWNKILSPGETKGNSLGRTLSSGSGKHQTLLITNTTMLHDTMCGLIRTEGRMNTERFIKKTCSRVCDTSGAQTRLTVHLSACYEATKTMLDNSLSFNGLKPRHRHFPSKSRVKPK